MQVRGLKTVYPDILYAIIIAIIIASFYIQYSVNDMLKSDRLCENQPCSHLIVIRETLV